MVFALVGSKARGDAVEFWKIMTMVSDVGF